jgi:hypothetical protein
VRREGRLRAALSMSGYHRRMRVLATLFVVVVVAAAGAASAATSRGEIHGVVKQPVGGACAEGNACSGPAAHVTLVFSRRGQTVARATTSRRGRYQLTVAPGLYAVRVASDLPLRVTPNRVRITAATSRRVNFLLGDATKVA